MGASVSNWNPNGLPYAQAVAESKAAVKAYRAAYAEHPFAGAYEGASVASQVASEAPRWRGTEKTFANGVRRVVIRKVTPNPQATLDRAIQRDLRMPTGAEVDRDPAEWRERNARRARMTVVDKAVAAGMNSLHTLTFRENVTDLDEALRCWDLYRRACQKLLKGWRYVMCWQRQERGAIHFHLATYRLPRYLTESGVKINSWDVMRQLWRRAAGAHGGNFDEVKVKRRNGSRAPLKRAGQIARYIGRYIGRDIGADAEDLKGRKSFATSKGIELPRPARYLWDGDQPLADLIAWAMQRVGTESANYWFSSQIEVFFIESDPTGPPSVGG